MWLEKQLTIYLLNSICSTKSLAKGHIPYWFLVLLFMCDNDLLFSFRSSNAIVFQYHHHAKCPNLLYVSVWCFLSDKVEKRRPLPQGSILVRKTVDTNLTLLPDKLLTSSFSGAKNRNYWPRFYHYCKNISLNLKK